MVAPGPHDRASALVRASLVATGLRPHRNAPEDFGLIATDAASTANASGKKRAALVRVPGLARSQPMAASTRRRTGRNSSAARCRISSMRHLLIQVQPAKDRKQRDEPRIGMPEGILDRFQDPALPGGQAIEPSDLAFLIFPGQRNRRQLSAWSRTGPPGHQRLLWLG